jgi:hypothetical protein
MSHRTPRTPARRWTRRLIAVAVAGAAATGALATTAGPAQADTVCGFANDRFFCVIDNGGGAFTYANSLGEIFHYGF